MIKTIFLALALALTALPAQAQQSVGDDGFFEMRQEAVYSPREGRGARVRHPATIVAHPAGCPRRAFCGCGASVRVFGRSVRNLWLAVAWYMFPRAAPAGGMVAVRPGHVFVLEAPLGGHMWRVYDANSGGGKTRIHARSIRGYTIVNPHGGARYAAAGR